MKKLLDIFPNMINESKICSQGLSLTINSCISEVGRSVWDPEQSPKSKQKATSRKLWAEKVFSLSFLWQLSKYARQYIHSLTGKTVPTGYRPLGKLLNISVPQL